VPERIIGEFSSIIGTALEMTMYVSPTSEEQQQGKKPTCARPSLIDSKFAANLNS